MGHSTDSGRNETREIIKREYETLAQFGEIKVVRSIDGTVRAPMSAQTSGRIYATLDNSNNIKYITFYTLDGEKKKQIDVTGQPHNGIDTPHTHEGLNHDTGFHELTRKEKEKVEKVLSSWEKKRKELGI